MKKTIRLCARLFPIWGLALVAALLAGCFDVEESLNLQKDLSGTAGFSMTLDFEPMALMGLRMQREMAGIKGDPTPAEIEKAKQDFLASKKSEKSPAQDFAAQKAELEKSLPPGVQLIDAGADDQGMKMRMHFKFRFDDVAKLSKLQFSPPAAGGSGPKSPGDQPFSGLKVVDEGKTVLVTSIVTNPLGGPGPGQGQAAAKPGEGGPGMAPGGFNPEMMKQMGDVFQGVRIAFKLDTPLEVVESNATRKEGHTLYWEYDMKNIDKLNEGMRVRLRK